MNPKGSGRGWFVFPHGGGSGWCIRYRISNSPPKWRDHRIPPPTKGGPAIPRVDIPEGATVAERDRLLEPARKVAEAYAEKFIKARKEHLRKLGITDEEQARAASQPATPTAPARDGSIAFQTFAKQWTDGDLHKAHPDHVKDKKSVKDDKWRLEKHVYPVAGNVRLDAFTLDDAERVLRKMPAALSSTSRRHVAQLMHHVLSLAVFPARLIPSNPLPRGFLPHPDKSKAMAYLYPDEDGKLLATAPSVVPLCYRILYGFLDREGLRSSEAASLTWSDLDLKRGAIALDKNKTDDPRAWALSPGVVRALDAWRKLTGGKDHQHVFRDDSGAVINVDRLAERFRIHLKAAKVDRKQLYERSKERRPIRIHDLRATFITIALANGKSETWVQDRTGHRSSMMINRYRRAARSVTELGLGDLQPLDLAIPELRKPSTPQPPKRTATRVAAERSDGPDMWQNMLQHQDAAGRAERASRESEAVSTRCTRRDSNPQALRRRNLKRLRSQRTELNRAYPKSCRRRDLAHGTRSEGSPTFPRRFNEGLRPLRVHRHRPRRAQHRLPRRGRRRTCSRRCPCSYRTDAPRERQLRDRHPRSR